MVLKFESAITELFNTLRKRIESGSEVKVGPFELGQLNPQNPSQQAAKTESEIKENLKSDETVLGSGIKNTLRTNYLIAEELAIRAIETEFNQSARRQVAFGDRDGFDGIFALEGQAQIIEVKYFTNAVSAQRVRDSISRIKNLYESYGWRNVRIIFVLVAENEKYFTKVSEKLADIAEDMEAEVIFRSYTLTSLREKFGV